MHSQNLEELILHSRYIYSHLPVGKLKMYFQNLGELNLHSICI
jgi:hypothetical protein